jgi:hypothetical protein
VCSLQFVSTALPSGVLWLKTILRRTGLSKDWQA